ncbi:hypothetical protein TIFTF001_025233 [Ficus carica]|uniref:Uncharacterized protein n=1 Tax=Ficus carica TaxID=3494 RepID=A0AA88APM2_FICCA|nr:hypothetical protein TIFTF001_025233 [Ficus carica]
MGRWWPALHCMEATSQRATSDSPFFCHLVVALAMLMPVRNPASVYPKEADPIAVSPVKDEILDQDLEPPAA